MKFQKNEHVVETSLKREAVRLKAEGYVQVDEAPELYAIRQRLTEAPAAEAPKPSPKPSN